MMDAGREQEVTALMVAADILRIAKRKGIPLNLMQLLKLTYISYGWWLVDHPGEPLFKDPIIEAWHYGPVIPDIWRTFEHFGYEAIPQRAVDDDFAIMSETVRQLLEAVVDAYGSNTGFGFSDLTKETEIPWEKVYKNGVRDVEIDPRDIETYYNEVAEKLRERYARVG